MKNNAMDWVHIAEMIFRPRQEIAKMSEFTVDAPFPFVDEDGAAANADRIVAAVNACTGIPQHLLEQDVVATIADILKSLVEQSEETDLDALDDEESVSMSIRVGELRLARILVDALKSSG
jgi:hypothetical protein